MARFAAGGGAPDRRFGGTDGQDQLVRVVLRNRSPTPALNARPIMVNDHGARILRLAPAGGGGAPHFMLSGWNAAPPRTVPAT